MNVAGLNQRRADARVAWRLANEHADWIEAAFSGGGCTIEELVIANEQAQAAWEALLELHHEALEVLASFGAPAVK